MNARFSTRSINRTTLLVSVGCSVEDAFNELLCCLLRTSSNDKYQSCSQDRQCRDRDQGQDQQCQDRDQDRHLQDQDRDQDRHLQDQDRDQDQVAVHNKMRITYKLLNMLSTIVDCNQMTMSTSTQKLFCAQTMFSRSFKNVH